MKNALMAMAVLMALACGGRDVDLVEHNSTAISVEMPSGWIPWDSGVAESADEPATPACGHECPGSPWTHVAGTCPATQWTDADGVVHVDVDWDNCGGAPYMKTCYCRDAAVLREHAGDYGVIDFETSTDEVRCQSVREFWLQECAKH